jgi:hypothetical protein
MLRMFSSKKKGKEKDPNNDVVDGNGPADNGPAAAVAARPPAEARAFPVLDAEDSTQFTCMYVLAAMYSNNNHFFR